MVVSNLCTKIRLRQESVKPQSSHSDDGLTTDGDEWSQAEGNRTVLYLTDQLADSSSS